LIESRLVRSEVAAELVEAHLRAKRGTGCRRDRSFGLRQSMRVFDAR
jgi:hypothetical protein